MRSYINPHGYEAFGFVSRANCMISRKLAQYIVSCFVNVGQKVGK